ncbi:thyroid receptor-interacting protein 11 [Bicyclus anynana]|uniref:Thyroid receptor-interacting protein 11 n=1 Tax=Bicyclus anynana TaxID=110368 RepID=A0ABM3LFN8_BICAN|nr:thyroid receptor-interacting protein 11 [Bicyclus anynana]
MACLETPIANGDSEMEEGEIVDEADDLSDISSEEEFLLRQRLQVLENYNNVLERKEAKRTSVGSDNAADVCRAEADKSVTKLTLKITKTQKPVKVQHKQKRSKIINKQSTKIKEHKRKNHRIKKKITIVSDSDISDDEYRNKRRRLENAVCLSNIKHDTTTLKDRLSKMLCESKAEAPNIEAPCEIIKSPETIKNNTLEVENNKEEPNLAVSVEKSENINTIEPIHICSDENLSKPEEISQDVIDTVVIENKEESHSDCNSDEDLELLRQMALKTKSVKIAMHKDQKSTKSKAPIISEDEDSDTAELRMICLKSALLKKAIEIKQKQKLQKRLSQSSIVPDDFDIEKPENDINVDNNTDIESVDMDIGSDAEDKGKIINDSNQKNETKINNNMIKDELEDDEDLLRAKLLTSLSKNLPNLVQLNDLDSVLAKPVVKSENTAKVPPQPQPEEKKFIIQLRESDSEGENEATKNLTKMHMKLSEQQEFQNKLDLFLKSTRMEVEKSKLPDVVQKPTQKVPEKFVIKAMNHLPKSEQIEYKNLVKRMAELEKLKQARQNATIAINKVSTPKETLKPRNLSIEAYKIAYAKKIEDKIAQSRKNIAEQSGKMLSLKEEATKLSQKYKIVATELRNIATAITMNKKQQKLLQIGLSKIRHQHQMLIKSSPVRHSNSQNIQIGRQLDKIINTTKLQKENDPSTEEHKNIAMLKSVKVSVVNNFNNDNIQSKGVPPRLSVQVDMSNNKKVVKMPSPIKDRVVDIKKTITKSHISDVKNEEIVNTTDKQIDTRCRNETESCDEIPANVNDYKSPLGSLQCRNWEEDPNGVLCPFEVGGSCRDTDCKYLHPKPHKTE